jgi:glucose/arabinose dehydrogenase
MEKYIHLSATIALALLASVGPLLVLPAGPAQGAANVPLGFIDSPVVKSGLTNPTDMEFSPDGRRLFVAEQAGRVRIAKPDGTLATFLNISTKVDSSGERGLQTLTFDPAFSTNGYVYLHYTRKATSSTPVHNRVVRVTASGDKVVAGSEKLIFKLGNQTSNHHMGGALEFGTDGKLYITTGDNETPDRAQQLTNLFGKTLRINKSGTIPTGNPFYSTASGNNRAIWALGFRNPFKFDIRPNTDGTETVLINDVGQDTWEEINQLERGANYGWNVYEGPESNPQYVDPNFAYGHDGVEPAITGCAITGGTFYDPTSVTFPSQYAGDYFFADFCSGWIRSFDPSSGAVSDFASAIVRPVDLEVSNDGDLYYLSRGNPGGSGSVGKIRYTSNP